MINIVDPERQKFISQEHSLLQVYSGLYPTQYALRDLLLPNQSVIHYCEINTDPSPKPKLLMIHGFGGNNVVFYKVFQPLSRAFHIISMDMPGMGFNSRPNNPFNSTQSCIDFFISHIKMFVETLQWKKFSLLGHSLGAFFSSHYFDLFPDSIERLYLVSPAGFNPFNETAKAHAMEKLDNVNWFARSFAKSAINDVMEEKKSPFELGWTWLREGFFLNIALNKYFSHKRFKFSEDEQERMKNLTRYLVTRPQCGERALGYVLRYGPTSEVPILNIMEKYKKRQEDICLIYGISDWMDDFRTVKNLREKEIEIKLYKIKDADHQIPFQNWVDLAKCVLDVHEGKGEFPTYDAY